MFRKSFFMVVATGIAFGAFIFNAQAEKKDTWAIIHAGTLLTDARKKAKRVGPIMSNALHMAYKGGVKIAFGTDSGVSVHGINGQELLLMVKAGMSKKDVLISATVSARFVGINQEYRHFGGRKICRYYRCSWESIKRYWDAA